MPVFDDPLTEAIFWALDRDVYASACLASHRPANVQAYWLDANARGVLAEAAAAAVRKHLSDAHLELLKWADL